MCIGSNLFAVGLPRLQLSVHAIATHVDVRVDGLAVLADLWSAIVITGISEPSERESCSMWDERGGPRARSPFADVKRHVLCA